MMMMMKKKVDRKMIVHGIARSRNAAGLGYRPSLLGALSLLFQFFFFFFFFFIFFIILSLSPSPIYLHSLSLSLSFFFGRTRPQSVFFKISVLLFALWVLKIKIDSNGLNWKFSIQMAGSSIDHRCSHLLIASWFFSGFY